MTPFLTSWSFTPHVGKFQINLKHETCLKFTSKKPVQKNRETLKHETRPCFLSLVPALLPVSCPCFLPMFQAMQALLLPLLLLSTHPAASASSAAVHCSCHLRDTRFGQRRTGFHWILLKVKMTSTQTLPPLLQLLLLPPLPLQQKRCVYDSCAT